MLLTHVWLLGDRPMGISKRFRLGQSVFTRERSVREFEQGQSRGPSAKKFVNLETLFMSFDERFIGQDQIILLTLEK